MSDRLWGLLVLISFLTLFITLAVSLHIHLAYPNTSCFVDSVGGWLEVPCQWRN